MVGCCKEGLANLKIVLKTWYLQSIESVPFCISRTGYPGSKIISEILTQMSILAKGDALLLTLNGFYKHVLEQ